MGDENKDFREDKGASGSENLEYEEKTEAHDRKSDAMDEGGGEKKKQRPRYRKKVLDTRNLVIDYKNTDVLQRFVSRTGKILPRRMTGASAKVQRKIAREIKRSRMINLLPYTKR